MMKNIFLIILVFFALGSQAQVVTADPAITPAQLTNDDGNITNVTTLSNLPFQAKVFVLNNSATDAIPTGTTRIVVGLGGLLNIDTSSVKLNSPSSSISTYYRFSAANVAGEVQLIGLQIREIPVKYIDSLVFRVFATALGTSAVTTSIETLPGLDDRNPNNNSYSTPYTVTSVTLPVNLTQFDVVKSACNFDVTFSTENEVNLSRFEIEASKNGIDFVKIGEIASRNASKYNSSFPITDALKSTNLFVRLKSIDRDATFQYSSVKRIAGNCDSRRTLVLGAYPNPIRSGRSLTITSKEGNFEGKYSVSLIDVTGRLLEVKEMQLNNVSNFRFDIGSIAAGQYLIKVANTDQTESSIIRFQRN